MFGLQFYYGFLTVGLKLRGGVNIFLGESPLGLKLSLCPEFKLPMCPGTGLKVCVVGGGWVVGGVET